MADVKNLEQKSMFENSTAKPNGGKTVKKKARWKANGYEPPNLGKAIRLPVPDFSDPNRPPVCLEVDFPIAPINALSNLEGNAGKPIYQMSKWWARRRSSVFRSLLIAAATVAPGDPSQAAKRLWDHYYCNHQKPAIFASFGCSTSSWAAGPLWSRARGLASKWWVLILTPSPGS